MQRDSVSNKSLAQAVTEFIEWRAFAYWVRLIVEQKGMSYPQVESAIRKRCPGFLEPLIEYKDTYPEDPRFLFLQLMDWIDRHVFKGAKWEHEVVLYASRDERLGRVRDYSLTCAHQWKMSPPHSLPEYDVWLHDALTRT